MIVRSAVIYLVALVFFGWGIATVQFKIFPWDYIHPVLTNIAEFAKGDTAEDTNLVGRLKNDLGLSAERHAHTIDLDIGDLTPITVDDPSIFGDRDLPLFESTLDQGYYLIHGTFQFADALHGAILIDTAGKIRKTIPYSFPAGERDQEYRGNGHGFALGDDGRLYPHAGDILRSYSWCGDMLWTGDEGHHSVTLTDRNTLWHLQGDAMTERAIRTGKKIRTIRIYDIIKANPQDYSLTVTSADNWVHDGSDLVRKNFKADPFHQNDALELPAELADEYDLFDAGDLLISMRSLNAVYVIDPDTLKIKWKTVGLTDRQHDPEFYGDNKISIFDNRKHSGTESEILIVDTITGETSVFYKGSDIFTAARGNHTLVPDGSIVITSPHIGQVAHVSPDGQILSRFVNVIRPIEKKSADTDAEKDTRVRVLRVYNAEFVSEDQFRKWEKQCD